MTVTSDKSEQPSSSASAEGGDKGCVGLGRDAAEKLYQPRRLLLRTADNRPSACERAEEGYEIPTPHALLYSRLR